MISRLRRICMALPGAEEKEIFGHPTFRVGGKMFCVFHGPEDQSSIAIKVGKAAQGIFLDDPRFFRTPYIGHHGWVSLRTSGPGRIDWNEVEELVNGSYQLVVPRRFRVSKPL